MPKLNEIEGLLIKREIIRKPENMLSPVQMGINQAIDQMGERAIGMNREKLAELCYALRCKINGGKGFTGWDVVGKDKSHPIYWVCLEDADAIIAKESEIIEVKK